MRNYWMMMMISIENPSFIIPFREVLNPIFISFSLSLFPPLSQLSITESIKMKKQEQTKKNDGGERGELMVGKKKNCGNEWKKSFCADVKKQQQQQQQQQNSFLIYVIWFRHMQFFFFLFVVCCPRRNPSSYKIFILIFLN